MRSQSAIVMAVFSCACTAACFQVEVFGIPDDGYGSSPAQYVTDFHHIKQTSEARYTSPPAASKIVAMTHEVVEHHGSREEGNRIADLWRSGMEIVFGDPEDRPCDLLPPEAFPAPEDIRPDPEVRRRGGTSDEETGRNSRAVYWRFFSSCAGWPCPPTPGEFYDAIREESPNRRQRTVLRTWFREATNSQILWGWIEEAYTWPMLVAAIHRVGYRRNALNHYLNGFAKRRTRAS